MTTRTMAALVAVACFSATAPGCGGDGKAPGWKPGDPVTLDVAGAFPAGTAVRDAYSGRTATVAADGKVAVLPGPEGLVLLERSDATPSTFRWDAATVYFAITDRFHDGDPANNRSYGREPDGALEVGTWHGGDLAGLTAKLDHLVELGVNAVWISPPVEQVHGWVGGGGSGDFVSYAYAGYWALDFTRLDANFGTPAEFRAFVDAAHEKGIRVVLDVVLNHPGYATGDDLVDYLPAVFKDGTGAAFEAWTKPPGGNYFGWNDLVNYQSASFAEWWGVDWIRAGLGGGYDPAGNTDLTSSLVFLPDFKTEATKVVSPPPFLLRKADTGVTPLTGATVSDYLVRWHTDWVRNYGIDGFRCDTAKHVELATWAKLKTAGQAALAEWKTAHPDSKLDDLPFWMMGEVFPHGLEKDAYFDTGKFDSLINFTFFGTVLQGLQGPSLVDASATLETTYSTYAAALADPAFDVTSYLSSHDTTLAFTSLGEDPRKQQDAGTALLLAPGSVQVFYGEESGRKFGPGLSDPTAGTRSDMNWDSMDASILAHWRKVGTFRRNHAAVGAGTHLKLESPAGTYAFQRKLGADAVVVIIARRG